jgi:hypothetical protein
VLNSGGLEDVAKSLAAELSTAIRYEFLQLFAGLLLEVCPVFRNGLGGI